MIQCRRFPVRTRKRFSYMKSQAKANTERPNRPQHNLGKITKTFQQDGRWIEKKTKTAILICACGTRYIKTRPRQASCLRCMFRPA
jgi:hypothetical protein